MADAVLLLQGLEGCPLSRLAPVDFGKGEQQQGTLDRHRNNQPHNNSNNANVFWADRVRIVWVM